MGWLTSYRLRSRDAATRARAARTLGVAGRTANVASLEPLLDDEDPGVRRAAVEALGAIGGESVAPHLLGAARGADQVRPATEAAVLRASAVEALAAVGGPAVPALLTAVSDRHTHLRECAVEALARIGGDGAAEGLRQALADDRSALRQIAAAALARSAG
ncbi:MAG TPA: HEAT repeat domain-containing protein, partial [Vicinamibacterales bacterium]|nr:HEAT repeat domain-containing protein [Vicinamibacterales bacterium]